MKALLCVVVLCAASPVFAAPPNYPLVGQLSSKSERGQSISYTCLLNGDTLHCDFTQVLITHPDVYTSDQIDAAISQMKTAPFDKDTCSKVEAGIETLGAGKNPDPSYPFTFPLTADDIKAALATFRMYSAACTDPSEANLRAVLRAGQDTTARTCNVATLPFDLNFEFNAANGRWQSVAGPEGACGDITSAFWEPVSDPIAASNTWNYHQIKTPTISTGTDLFSKPCSETKNTELFYIFQDQTVTMQCDIVHLGLF